MGYKQTIGEKGESEACKYLELKGYNILEKNYRCKLRRGGYYCKR